MDRQEITPFRMQILMDVAARVMRLMVTGAWHISFDEMCIVLDLVRHGIEEGKERNKEGGTENVSENSGA